MDRKKLVIAHWDLGIGGAKTKMRELLLFLELSQPSLEVHVLLKRSKPDLINLRSSSVHIHAFSEQTYQGKRLQFMWWIVKKVVQVKPTHYLSLNNRFVIPGLIAQLLLALKKHSLELVQYQVVLLHEYVRLHESWYWQYLIGPLYNKVNKIICLNSVIADELREVFKVLDKRLYICSSWIIGSSVTRESKSKNYDLVYVARMDVEKRPTLFVELVDALKKDFPDIRAVMLGSGTLDQKVRRLIEEKKLEDNISFLGYRDDPASFISQSRLHILPTTNEGVPRAVMEAGLQEVPTIITKYPGVSDVLKHGTTGLIVSDQDLVGETRRLLKNNTRLKKMGTAARKYISEQFGASNMEKFIEEVLK